MIGMIRTTTTNHQKVTRKAQLTESIVSCVAGFRYQEEPYVHSAFRYSFSPGDSYGDLGFRCARSEP